MSSLHWCILDVLPWYKGKGDGKYVPLLQNIPSVTFMHDISEYNKDRQKNSTLIGIQIQICSNIWNFSNVLAKRAIATVKF